MTVADALSTAERLGVWMLHDAHYPSLTTAVAGAPIRGGWWAHPAGKTIFNLGSALGEHSDMLVVPLLDRKICFVHRRLWPPLLGAVTEGWARRPLGSAEALFLRVVEAGTLAATGKEAAFLAGELYLLGASEHGASGAHHRVLRSWPHWAAEGGVAAASAGKSALEGAVETACPGASTRLPWNGRLVRVGRSCAPA